MLTTKGISELLTKKAGIIDTLSKDELSKLRKLYAAQAKASKIYDVISGNVDRATVLSRGVASNNTKEKRKYRKSEKWYAAQNRRNVNKRTSK